MINSTEEKIKSKLYMFPLIFIIAIIPLIVFVRAIPLKGVLYQCWTGDKISYDFFSFYKSILLIVMALVSFILLVSRRWKDNFTLKINPFYFPVVVYTILVILSTLFSEFRSISTFGFIERYEGAYTIFAYMLILYISFNFITHENEVNTIIYCLLISASIVGIVGMLQYFGYDILQTFSGKLIILPKELHKLVNNIKFNFSGYSIYATMYNSNNVGSYMTLIFPLTFGNYLYSKSPLKKFIFGLLSCLMFGTWIGCRSRAGLVGGLFAIVLISFLLRKYLKYNLKKFIVIIPYIIIFIIMNQVSDGSLLNKVSTISPLIEQSFADDKNVELDNIIIINNKASIIGKEWVLNIITKNNEVFYLDDKNEAIEVYNDKDEIVHFKNPKYSDFTFKLKKEQDKMILYGKLRNMEMNWLIYDDKVMLIGGQQGRFTDKIYHPERWGFKNWERFGSSRGYIWSRTIPMIKDTFILGNGPDTFSLYFPQYDLVGKLKNFGRTTILVDKPHNYYLQTAVNTGVLSLIALLTLFGMYIISSLRLYMKADLEDYSTRIGILIFAAVCGYLIAAFFNDSVVSVAPVFWVLLGTGFSINHKLKTQMKAAKATVDNVELLPSQT